MELTEKLKPLTFPLVASLTLGLAPFTPQPHVWEKLTWLFTGHSFAPIDVFDLIMHGTPWIWLLWTAVQVLRTSSREQVAES
jgi:hypothetical protein